MHACCLPILFLFATIGLGQQAVPMPAERTAPKKVVVPPGELTVQQLVQTVARVAKHSILCDEQQIIGAKPIALTEPVTLEAESCEELLCSLLRTRGLALVPVDAERGVYEVIAINGPRGHEIASAAVTRTPEEVLAQPFSKRMVITSVRLQHLNAPPVMNALRPLFAGGPDGSGLAVSMLGNAGITLRGWQNDVAAALKVIQDNDKPMAGAGAGALPPGFAAGGAPGGVAPAGDLAARVVALEKQVEELKRVIASLQQAAGK
jgi:hypothetical protein